MSGPLKHGGPTIVLAGSAFVVPALSLGAIERYEEQIDGIEQLPRAAQLRLIVDLAHAALVRNYPDLTRADVAELVDVRNAQQVYAAVMGSAIPAPDPSALIEGEAGAMAGGTGQPSTPTSAPVSGGPSSTAARTSRSTSSRPSPATGATTRRST